MKLFAKLAITLSLLCTPIVFSPAMASAADVFGDVCSGRGANTSVCKDVAANKDKGNPVVNILGAAISILSWAIGIAAVFVIIVCGIRFITSQGDPQGIQSAKAGVFYALIGLAVAAFAQVIVAVVLNKIG